MFVSKRKKYSTRSDSMRTPEFIHKVKQTTDGNGGQSMRSMAKNIACVGKDNQKDCSWRHSIQILRDKERSIYLRKIKRKPLKQIQQTLKPTQKSCRSKNSRLIIITTTPASIFGLLTLQISIHYYVGRVVQKKVNEHPHNTNISLKAVIVFVMSDINKEQLIRAYNIFRPGIEAIIDASGGFIE